MTKQRAQNKTEPQISWHLVQHVAEPVAKRTLPAHVCHHRTARAVRHQRNIPENPSHGPIRARCPWTRQPIDQTLKSKGPVRATIGKLSGRSRSPETPRPQATEQLSSGLAAARLGE
jgi:hypothetical protein